MHTQIITPNLWTTQPWKNGGGVTHELASEKDELGILWRLSIAEVNQDGPFSVFPDIDRVIVLLEGDGFKLTSDEGLNQVMDRPYEPFCFPGEQKIQCTLLGGAVRDFNVMTRRNSVKRNSMKEMKVLFQVFDFKVQSVFEMPLLLGKYVVFVAKGAINAQVNTNTYFLQEHHTLIIDADEGLDELRVLSEAKDSVVFFIALN